MIQIPKQIEDFNFVLLGGDDGKKPFEKGWQKKIHKIDDPILQKHIQDGKNYGVQCNNSFININGETRFLIIIDFDKKDFQDLILNQFPETFTTTSGSPKKCYHLWFASDNNKPFKIKDENQKTLADIIGEGNQVVAPGSKHNSGSIYSIVKDIPFTFIPYTELEAILIPYDKTPKKPEKPIKQYIPKQVSNDITEKIYNSISMESILSELGVDTSKNPTNCPLDLVPGEKCMGWTDETAHCFGHDKSWNKFSLIREVKNLTDKETFEWFAEKAGMTEELKNARKEYSKKKFDKEELGEIFTRKGQAKAFIDIQPIFYDKSGLFWIWNNKEKKWEITDEVELLNYIEQSTGQDVINSNNRTEIINSLKQLGRQNTPLPIENNWIQFQDKIYDIKTGNSFEATSKYFATNPIPYKISGNPQTPVMDKIFEEWVGKDYVKTLHEIIAYCLIPDYPIHRLFCFIGSGLNGKSCFLRLLKKFVGESNVTSTELDVLLSSRFEVTRLHKKLVCIMGETNFSEMSKTSIIKKLTGQDIIGFEYKNKNPFEDLNYAKILIATNNLPTTTDKTIGFYRRWLIIDFPNQFSEKKDVLSTIPEKEFNNLATESLARLNELLQNREFHNEGSIEDRMKRYEDHSDPLEKFMKEFVIEDYEGSIWKFEFEKRLNSWCKENRFRTLSEETIGKKLKEKGLLQSLKYSDWLIEGENKRLRTWVGIKWKV